MQKVHFYMMLIFKSYIIQSLWITDYMFYLSRLWSSDSPVVTPTDYHAKSLRFESYGERDSESYWCAPMTLGVLFRGLCFWGKLCRRSRLSWTLRQSVLRKLMPSNMLTSSDVVVMTITLWVTEVRWQLLPW